MDIAHRRRWLARRLAAAARPGQALIETALVMLAVCLCLFGLLTAHRIIDGRLQVETLARETARVMGEAASYEQALAAADQRAQAVAAGLNLAPDRLSLSVEVDSAFPRGSIVSATASYRLPLAAMPFGLGEPTVSATARQPVQVYGSRRP